MTMLQEQAVRMIQDMSDDNVGFLLVYAVALHKLHSGSNIFQLWVFLCSAERIF